MTLPQDLSPHESQSSHETQSKPRVFDRVRLISIVVLTVLLLLCIAFSWATRGAMEELSFLRQKQGTGATMGAPKTLVDQRPWQTAQTLAALAVTAEEKDYARQAERLADHEVDQAFATALRDANLKAEHRTFTGAALALSKKVDQLKQVVAQDQAQVDRLNAAPQAHAQPDNDDLAIAKAQLGLDSDELADAQQDLGRASGDNRADIQAELSSREAAMRKFESETKNDGEIAVLSVARQPSLAGRLRGWFKQRSRAQLLQQAIGEAQNDVLNLTAQHNALEAQAGAVSPAAQEADHAAQLASLKDRSAERQLLSIYDDRIQTEQQLQSVYQKWAAQLDLQHRIVLHLVLDSLSTIAFILICMVAGDALVRRLMATASADQRQRHTLRSILELSIQVLGVLLILLVVFGWPQQTPTILGLVTAGITIVLQDFILAFFGWFLLMGKNGIHVGDRVEINGVGGEVTEIGLMNTTLLETGNLADMGLPTGRRISFMNSFAIRGQYFNFSTAGQWMWDEITVSLPASADPRAALERIQKTVQEETRESAVLATREWQRTMHGGHLSKLDAEPVANLLTTAAGFDIQIRYVTRASSRFETRVALYRRVFDLVQNPKTVEALPAESAR